MERSKEMRNKLYETIIKLQTKEDCERLLSDLCTENEVDQMSQRVVAAKMLLEKCTYNQVINKTEISSATLSRVSNSIHHGKDGYKDFISYKKEED